jgi:hypothetical protein
LQIIPCGPYTSLLFDKDPSSDGDRSKRHSEAKDIRSKRHSEAKDIQKLWCEIPPKIKAATILLT